MSETGSTAVRPCVEALAGRPDELRRALGGRSLLVLVEYSEEGPLRLMLTRSGVVGVVPSDEPFEAQVEVRGTEAQIRAFIADRMTVGEAILDGVLTIRLPEADTTSYAELRTLVAEVANSSC